MRKIIARINTPPDGYCIYTTLIADDALPSTAHRAKYQRTQLIIYFINAPSYLGYGS